MIQIYILILNWWRKNSWTLKKHIDLQSQSIYDDINDSKKFFHVLEDGASGVQVDDIEQAIV